MRSFPEGRSPFTLNIIAYGIKKIKSKIDLFREVLITFFNCLIMSLCVSLCTLCKFAIEINTYLPTSALACKNLKVNNLYNTTIFCTVF